MTSSLGAVSAQKHALLVCMCSRPPPKAAEVRKEVIVVFMAYRRGHLELSARGSSDSRTLRTPLKPLGLSPASDYRELRYVTNEAQTPSMKRASCSVTLASPLSSNGCLMPCSSEL